MHKPYWFCKTDKGLSRAAQHSKTLSCLKPGGIF